MCKVSSKYCIAVNSATSALHLSCLAIGLKSKDILCTTPNSFVASANCGAYIGAEIDFIDIDPNTGLISISKVIKKLETAKKIVSNKKSLSLISKKFFTEQEIVKVFDVSEKIAIILLGYL